MAIVRKEWEDRYDEIKNMPEIPTNEQKKEEWEGKELQFKARLAGIKDTTSPEYKAVMAERKQAKKEFESQQIAYYSAQKYLDANGTNLAMVKKNFRQIDKTRENRDIYQSRLDELLAAKEANSQIEAKREQIQEEIKRLDEELKDLKQQEKDALKAIENFAKTPEQKAAAQSWLEEVRGKIKINQNEFSEKHKELKVELEKPLIEVPENDIKELQGKIDRCNKTCELLLQGKTIGEVYTELGKERTSQKEAQPTPEIKPVSKVDQEKQKTAQPTPEINPVSKVDQEEQKTAQPTPEINPVSKVDQEEQKTAQPTPEIKPVSEVDQEEQKTEQPTPKFDFDIEEGIDANELEGEQTGIKPLSKIIVGIGKGGRSMTAIKREGEETVELESKEISDDTNLEKVAEAYPTSDKWLIREIARAYTAGALTKEERNEQIEIYKNIMDGKDVEENKKKLKIDLKYDLTGLRDLDRDTKKEVKANAKKARKLEIAEVETYWSKFTNFVWNKVSDFVTWGRNLLPNGEKKESLPEPENNQSSTTPQEEFRKSMSYSDRMIAEADARGAFNHSWKPKSTPTPTQTEQNEQDGEELEP